MNTPGTMTVTLSDAPLPGSTAVVNFVLNGGTAGIGTDVQLHDPTVTSLTFNPGETSKTIALDIIGDTINEPTETFTVKLTGVTGGIIDPTPGANIGTGTILDNDPLPTVSIADAHITEGDSGTSAMTFTVSLSAASGQTVMVNAATLDGTATAGTTPTPHPGDSGAGRPGAHLRPRSDDANRQSVPIVGDTIDEQTEAFQVQLSNPTNATLDPVHGVATGTIFDNDLRAVSIADASIAEGLTGETNHMTFTVSIPTVAAQDIVVHYDTFDNTAKAGTDYTAQTDGTLMIRMARRARRSRSMCSAKRPSAQTRPSLVVKLHDPVNATLADAQGTGTNRGRRIDLQARPGDGHECRRRSELGDRRRP